MIRPRGLAGLMVMLGAGALGAAVIWWTLVFRVVVTQGYMPPLAAARCLATSTFDCELAMSLCTTGHLFGITRYSPALFLAAAAALTLGLALRLVRAA